MSTGKSFVDALMDALPSPDARLRAGAVLMKFEGQTIYLPGAPKAERRIRAAAAMLKNGMPPGDVATALIERFRVTGRTASRDIDKARNLS
jgi:Mor family transcriptional regulator